MKVWEVATRRELYHLSGFNTKITRLAFSPDDHFLVATGEDCRLVLWDMRTSEVVVTKSFPSPVSLLKWGPIDESARRPKYSLLYAHSSQLIVNELAYDLSVMQYGLSSVPCAMPSTGLIRDYLCSTLTFQNDCLLAGTPAGELVVFNINSKVFRGIVPVSSNGVHSIVGCNDTGNVFAGTGDGMINKLTGGDSQWSMVGRVRVLGQVVSLSLNHDSSELLAGTSAGKIYRVLTSDLSVSELASSHVSSVSCVAFGLKSDLFASISHDGTIRVWDLSDYSTIAETREKGKGLAICFGQSIANSNDLTTLITGWKDGSIRAYDAITASREWEIPNAHRGQILTVAAGEKFFVTGSSDGGVNVWSLFTREMILQFHEHKKDVTQVLVDVTHSHLIHSCGLDRAVFTYDLRQERRTVAHQVRQGGFKSMSQRLDSENELVTVSTDGKILFWDCDITDSVMQLTDPNRMRLNGAAVSPSGKYLAVGGDDYQVKIFHLEQQSLVACCLGHSDAVNDLQWSPDEKQIISVGDDACICVWTFFQD